jgi:hypothetical protein
MKKLSQQFVRKLAWYCEIFYFSTIESNVASSRNGPKPTKSSRTMIPMTMYMGFLSLTI